MKRIGILAAAVVFTVGGLFGATAVDAEAGNSLHESFSAGNSL